MFNDLRPQAIEQLSLFEAESHITAPKTQARDRLMGIMDRVNCTDGKRTLRLGAAGIRNAWAMKRESMTQAYTTRWEKLAVAMAM